MSPFRITDSCAAFLRISPDRFSWKAPLLSQPPLLHHGILLRVLGIRSGRRQRSSLREYTALLRELDFLLGQQPPYLYVTRFLFGGFLLPVGQESLCRTTSPMRS